MNNLVRSRLIRFSESRTSIPGPAGEHSVTVLQRGSIDVRLALAPAVLPSELTPHSQDEIYVIVRGEGVLFHDGKRDSFQSGDLLLRQESSTGSRTTPMILQCG